MTEYSLHYWDVPFRGVFPQLFLEEVKATYEWHDASEIYPEKSLKIHNPGMAPPYLFDAKTKKYLAQMPAILMHLAREHDYLPKRTETLDLALKTILDCNDVLMEFTNYYGQQMWSKKEWSDFRSNRFVKWMKIFEQTGIDHGLQEDKGFLLGSTISVADIATTALFGTIIHSFPQLKPDLEENAPRVSKLCERIEARPSIKHFLEQQREKYGQSYCGGEIEKSLRKMMTLS
jgi:glutathione S-transferase